MNLPSEQLNSRAALNRTRRAFLTMGAAAAAGFTGWSWLRSRSKEEGVEWPLRDVLRGNEDVAAAYFDHRHLSATFSPSQADANARTNGDVGLGEDFKTETWALTVEDSEGSKIREVTMAQIRALPRVEQVTQLNCIEGWTMVVQWAGVRFADFTEHYTPQFRSIKYVGMKTPDESYFVGLDSASAFHPQTLLCYEMNGADLSAAHGAPLRLVIPVKYGVKNIKRIGTVSYTHRRPDDYWANEGYDWYAGL